MHFSELASRRRSLGLSQDELAKRLGVTTSTLARWERGELTIGHPDMLRWALRAIEDDLAQETGEERHRRNLEARAEMERKIALTDAEASRLGLAREGER